MIETDNPNSVRRTYSVEEAAQILGISRSAAYTCVHSGDLPSRRFGRRVVIPRDALDRILAIPESPAPH